MTREENIAFIREKCIKANPIRQWCSDGEDRCETNTIRLADVLVALRAHDPQPFIFIDGDGLFCMGESDPWGDRQALWPPHDVTPPAWNIYKDDHTLQSDAMLLFIVGLL